MFDAYDTDKNGYLSHEEVYLMLQKVFASRGVLLSHTQLASMVENVFQKLDTNRDNQIDFNEFVGSEELRKLILETMK